MKLFYLKNLPVVKELKKLPKWFTHKVQKDKTKLRRKNK